MKLPKIILVGLLSVQAIGQTILRNPTLDHDPVNPMQAATKQYVDNRVANKATVIYSGVGAPLNTLGVNGDYYLRTDTSCIYGPKALEAWPFTCTSLVGATGPTGPTGPQGPIGQGLTFRGPWAALTAYAPYDMVTFSGSTYMATTSFVSGASFNVANWTLIASAASVATDAGGALIVGAAGPATGEQSGDIYATGASNRQTWGRICLGMDSNVCWTRSGTSASVFSGASGFTFTTVKTSNDGTAANPAFTFTNENNTGFYRTTNAINASIGGVPKLIFNVTGFALASDKPLRFSSAVDFSTSVDAAIERLGPAQFGFSNGTLGGNNANLRFGSFATQTGTEAAPAWVFAGDTATGFWRDTTNSTHYSVAGVRKFRYGSTGMTMAPGYALFWGSSTTDLGPANIDTSLCRASAGTLFVTNNTNACGAATGTIKAATVDASNFTQNGLPFTGAYPVAVQASGLIAHYDTKQGSGTVLTDVSGNGNNGTFAASPNNPAWTAGGQGGVTFTEASGLVGTWITLPTAVNTARTINMLVKCGPYTVLQQSTHPMLLGSSTNPGALLSLYNGGAKMSCSPGIASINSAGTSATTVTSTEDSAVGTHLLTFVLSASGTDHIYIDAQEVAAYGTQGTTGTLLSTSGALQLGSVNTNFSQANFNGTIYDVTFYTPEFTPQQVATYYDAITEAAKVRGIVLAPSRSVRTVQDLIYCVGDSITQAQSPAVPWCSTSTGLTGLGGTWTAINAGVGGSYLTDLLAQAEWRDFWHLSTGRNVVTLWGGTNNINGSESVTRVESQYQRLHQIWRAKGAKTIAMTMLSRSGFDAQKNTYNTWIRINWPKFSDGICDVAANPELGADNAFSNATYFYDTNTHPNAAGDAIIAACVANTINYMFGSTEAAPTLVTTATYNETSSDAWVLAQTGAGTINLVSAKGYTGMPRWIRNTTGAAITVAAATGENIVDGATSVTSVSVAAGTTLKLVPEVNDPTTGGAHWEVR